ncbi:MAG: hypothetical protein HFE81_03540 [Bacilli bacterium]|nr:hypothetical protein [Bacilli bacterium]
MDLRKYLSQYSDITKEIKELKQKIEKLENKSQDVVSDSVQSTTKNFPFLITHYKIKGKDTKIIKKIDEYKNTLESRYEELLAIQLKLEEYINKMPTSRLRRIFEYRYIEQYSWAKVALAIGGNTTTEESVRKEHDRYLKQI